MLHSAQKISSDIFLIKGGLCNLVINRFGCYDNINKSVQPRLPPSVLSYR